RLMSMLSRKCRCWCLTALLLGGCCSPVRERADHTVADLAAHPVDVRPTLDLNALPAPPAEEAPQPMPVPNVQGSDASEHVDEWVVPASAQPAAQKKREERIAIPRDVPGAGTPPIQLPADPEQRKAAIAALFPSLPPLGDDVLPGLAPDG